MIFRPWGELKWLFGKLERKKYDFLGCLSTEIRCTEALNLLSSLHQVNNSTFFEVVDPINSKLHDSLRAFSRERLAQIDSLSIIEAHNLLEPTMQIVDSVKLFMENSSGNIVFDLSSFPKRFFFPITKMLLKDISVKNLVVTYTVPEKYCEDNLSSNAQSWAPLPLFSPTNVDEDIYDLAVVGVGFIPLGLSDLLKDKQDKLDIKLLFPFPPGPPNYQRTWNFVTQMDATSKINVKQIYRIDAKALPTIFDKINALSSGNKKVLFAPYGPKTMSLAMCIYAVINDSGVYYTQPTSYAPHYSEGIRNCYAYLIKINGESLYH